MHYIQIQSYIAATCFDVIYAILRELVYVKGAFVGVMSEQFNSIKTYRINNVKMVRKIPTPERNIKNPTL